MARDDFGLSDFLVRWLAAAVLVALSYNPEGYSFYHWVSRDLSAFGPEHAVAGLLLVIGWVIFLRATFRSLGVIGLVLAVALLGAVSWLLVARGWLAADSPRAMSYTVLALLSLLLAVGMSWSFVRRRLSGQLDVDETDD